LGYAGASLARKLTAKRVRAADAKEVGVGNPAEETYCRPNKKSVSLIRALSIA